MQFFADYDIVFEVTGDRALADSIRSFFYNNDTFWINWIATPSVEQKTLVESICRKYLETPSISTFLGVEPIKIAHSYDDSFHWRFKTDYVPPEKIDAFERYRDKGES